MAPTNAPAAEQPERPPGATHVSSASEVRPKTCLLETPVESVERGDELGRIVAAPFDDVDPTTLELIWERTRSEDRVRRDQSLVTTTGPDLVERVEATAGGELVREHAGFPTEHFGRLRDVGLSPSPPQGGSVAGSPSAVADVDPGIGELTQTARVGERGVGVDDRGHVHCS